MQIKESKLCCLHDVAQFGIFVFLAAYLVDFSYFMNKGMVGMIPFLPSLQNLQLAYIVKERIPYSEYTIVGSSI